MEERMTQDSLFVSGEGDNWYRRNQAVLGKNDKIDWPLFIFDLIDDKSEIYSVIELGCCNGFRLDRLKREHLPAARCVGVDASSEAVTRGAALFPELELYQGVLSAPPVEGRFDLVIVNYVLHWIDRLTLAQSIAAIDRFVRDGGLLLLGDFLPNFQHKRRYHHLPEDQVFTYKQNYSEIFTSLGLYKKLVSFTYDHDRSYSYTLKPVNSSSRGVCTLLHKSTEDYYPEY
jgi:SAM-dependent methyltransferase